MAGMKGKRRVEHQGGRHDTTTTTKKLKALKRPVTEEDADAPTQGQQKETLILPNELSLRPLLANITKHPVSFAYDSR